MKKLLSKLVLLAPVALSLTACGLDLKEVYEGDGYNNVIFKENFYTKYDEKITPKNDDVNPFSKEAKADSIKGITVVNQPYQVGFENAWVYDDEIRSVPLVNVHRYDANDKNTQYYGEHRKANDIDDQFKTGYLSKLYDGWMFCGGRYQLSRVQLNERGFGQLFNKRLINKDYFALQFKCAVNDPYYQNEELRPQCWNVPAIFSKLKLYVNFYNKVIDENAYEVIQIPFDLTHVPTNVPEFLPEAYLFLSFSLKDLPLKECCGYSINYTWDKDDYMEQVKNPPMIDREGVKVPAFDAISDEEAKRIEFGLMLYEVLMPNSTWR